MPEFKSGERWQSLKVAGQKERNEYPVRCEPTEAGNVPAPQFRARAAASGKDSLALLNRYGSIP